MKLFLVIGIRHNAIVLAENREVAIRLAVDASKSENKKDPRVLFGYVGNWESHEVKELRLPKGYKLVKGQK